MTTTARPRKLSMLAFTLACEELEGIFTASFERAQALAAEGRLEEAKKYALAAEVASEKLERLVEGQLAAVGETRPAAPKLDTALAA